MSAERPPAGSPPTRPVPESPRTRREGVLPFYLVVLVALGLVGSILFREYRRGIQLVANEDAALDAVFVVREAEQRLHERVGHYGWVEDLEAAGLLEGLETRGDEGRRWVETKGYRIDVLLPHAKPSAQVVQIVPRDDALQPDLELVKEHVAIVARPLEPARSGHRIWYLDEKSELFLNEGVVDDEGAQRNQLPKTMVSASVPLDRASFLLWQRASDIEHQPD